MQKRDKNGLTEAEFLAQYTQKDYPRPSFTADIVVMVDEDHAAETLMQRGSCTLHVLLICRGGHPFLDCWALPGGFVNQHEDADTAAARELCEETGVSGLTMTPLGVYSRPDRDPRGWTVSAAYLALLGTSIPVRAGDDAAAACWATMHLTRQQDGTYALSVHTDTDADADADVLRCMFEVGAVRIDVADDAAAFVKRTHVVLSEGFAFDHAEILADACNVALGL